MEYTLYTWWTGEAEQGMRLKPNWSLVTFIVKATIDQSSLCWGSKLLLLERKDTFIGIHYTANKDIINTVNLYYILPGGTDSSTKNTCARRKGSKARCLDSPSAFLNPLRAGIQSPPLCNPHWKFTIPLYRLHTKPTLVFIIFFSSFKGTRPENTKI